MLLQNIGGIGNVTVIPKNAGVDEIYAFDTGPGNMIIDEVMFRLFNKRYDLNGETSAIGNVNEEMLEFMMSNPYIDAIPPKTTGREEFGEQYVEELLKKFNSIKKEDIVSTVTMFTAKSIAENYKNFILDKHVINKVIIGGGGAHNSTLLNYYNVFIWAKAFEGYKDGNNRSNAIVNSIRYIFINYFFRNEI